MTNEKSQVDSVNRKIFRFRLLISIIYPNSGEAYSERFIYIGIIIK